MTMFGKPKYDKYSRIVKITSVKDAKESYKQLKKEYLNAKTGDKKDRIMRVMSLATNRARALAKSPKISPDVKKRLIDVAKIYEREKLY